VPAEHLAEVVQASSATATGMITTRRRGSSPSEVCLDPVDVVDGVVHDLTGQRDASARGLRHTAGHDICRDLLGEPPQSFAAALAVATDVDAHPT